MSPEPRKMDSEIKSKWIGALRDGTYEQGRGRLRTNDDKYCCLGVLADVLGKPWCQLAKGGGGYAVDEPSTAMRSGSLGYLSEAICDEVGLEPYHMYELTDMNDLGKPFSQIADYIEARL